MLVLITVIVYFAVLLLLSHLVDKRGGNAAFFTGNRQSPWPLVAFGMIGASIS
jgi:Na+/proline symporter